MKIKSKGFTLIEVLIVVTILTIFFVAAISVAVVNLKNLESSRNKILGTRYAEELLEWLRGEKETDWQKFKTDIETTSTWCFYKEPPEWPSAKGVCDPNKAEKINNFFYREATMTVGINSISVKVIVYWDEGINRIEVPLLTHFEEIK